MDNYENYMVGFDEGKDDDVENVIRLNKKHNKNHRVSNKNRRKLEIKKGINRMKQLKDIADYESNDPIIRGIVKNHQLELIKPKLVLGSSRANRRRYDSCKSKLLDA